MSEAATKPRKPNTSRMGLIDTVQAKTMALALPAVRTNRIHDETIELQGLADALSVGQCFVVPILDTKETNRAKSRVADFVSVYNAANPDRTITWRSLKGLDNRAAQITHLGVWRIK